MSNRQTFPASLFPLRGDVSAEAGDVVVRVTGLQGVPVTPVAPTGTPALVFIDGLWTHVTLDGSILVDGVPQSDDYDFLHDGVSMEVLVDWPYGFSCPVFVDGVPAF